jgi:GT2 family glycosyltransferase
LPAEQPLVSIVILSYNSAEYIGACLSSLAHSEYRNMECIVVDNASRDRSAEVAHGYEGKLPFSLRVVSLELNLGCAGGNNAGWRMASGEILLFLNPDTEITPSFVSALVGAFESDSRVGIAGAKIYYPGTHRLQHAGAFILPNGMTNHFGAGEEDSGRYDYARDVDYVTGAGFAIRASLMHRLNGFDEDYFPAYFEEVDLCTRARKAGYLVRYVPGAVLYHHESVSLVANSPGFRRLYQRMRVRYCLKNYSSAEMLKKFVPFEAKWMLRQKQARGQRLEQFRAYAENFGWLVRKLVRRGR